MRSHNSPQDVMQEVYRAMRSLNLVSLLICCWWCFFAVLPRAHSMYQPAFLIGPPPHTTLHSLTFSGLPMIAF